MSSLSVSTSPFFQFSHVAPYLLTGNLGGLGRAVLLSRSVGSSDGDQKLIKYEI